MSYLRNASLIGGLIILGVIVYSPLLSYFTNVTLAEKSESEDDEQEEQETEKIVNELACVECGEPGRKRMNKDAKLVVSCRKCWSEVDETEEDVWSSVLRKKNSSISE